MRALTDIRDIGDRPRVVAGVAAVLVALVVAAAVLVPPTAPSGSSGAIVPPADSPAAVASAAPVPRFSHVYTIVLENRAASKVLGDASAPYLNALASRYGVSTAYTAVAHPSQPNYLALFSGSTQGVTDDSVHNLSAKTIADQLEAAGKSWRVYAENIPSGCFTGARADGGSDGPGEYVRKHNPAISFTQISSSPDRCRNIQPFASFDPAAAAYELIVPNMCHDGHDCSLQTADDWLRGFVPRIAGSPAWGPGSVLFITFDESDAKGRNNDVVTVVVSPSMVNGTRSTVAHNHYSLLRTTQAGLGLGCLANSCAANTLSEFFH